jgi:hypothetical protein
MAARSEETRCDTRPLPAWSACCSFCSRRWYALQWRYESDPAARRATLLRYLPATLVAQCDAAAGSPPATPVAPTDRAWLIWAAAGAVAILLLRRLVHGLRQHTRRDASVEPASASPVHASDSFQAAADEVLESLKPYIVAACADGASIPLGRLAQPFLFGYITQYCGAALQALTGKETDRQERAEQSGRRPAPGCPGTRCLRGPPARVNQAGTHATLPPLSAARSFDGG